MILHVDMSNRYNQGNYSVVACVSADNEHRCDNKFKKGLVIEKSLRADLLKKYSQVEIHVALVSLMIKNKKDISRLIICSDVNPVHEVIKEVSKFKKNKVRTSSIEELREEKNKSNLKSAADSFAKGIKRNFPKRKNKHRAKSYFKDGTVNIIERNSKEYGFVLNKLNKIKSKRT